MSLIINHHHYQSPIIRHQSSSSSSTSISIITNNHHHPPSSSIIHHHIYTASPSPSTITSINNESSLSFYLSPSYSTSCIGIDQHVHHYQHRSSGTVTIIIIKIIFNHKPSHIVHHHHQPPSSSIIIFSTHLHTSLSSIRIVVNHRYDHQSWSSSTTIAISIHQSPITVIINHQALSIVRQFIIVTIDDHQSS